MALDLDRVRALVTTVADFPVRDRRLRQAQERIEAAFSVQSVGDEDVRVYLRAVTAYFANFNAEARAQLRHVDRELERLYQRQYNLNAERGVAARRVEVTQGVLAVIAELGSR